MPCICHFLLMPLYIVLISLCCLVLLIIIGVQVGGLWMVSSSETSEILNIILYSVVIGITMLILYQFRPKKVSSNKIIEGEKE